MAKTEAGQGRPSRRAATKAFERAWKLLGRLEKRLEAARAAELKRRRQLAAAVGPEAARRQVQLDEAVADVARTAALLTELSEMIAANARAQAGQTVSDVAHEAAQAVRAEAQARTAAQVAAPGPAPATARRTATRRAVAGSPGSAAAGSGPQPAATRPRTSKPSVPRPASPKPAGRKTAVPKPASVKPATTRAPGTRPTAAKPAPNRPTSTSRRPATAVRPRSRRSLQPGKPDPDPSSS